jgi:hypothetical protein
MNANHIFTHKRMGLDRRVWWLMLFFCIVSIGLFGYNSINRKPCSVISLTARSESGSTKQFYINEPIHFTAFMSGSEKVDWDFGDKTTAGESNSSIFHSFRQTGNFIVKATIDGGCEEVMALKVIKRPGVELSNNETPALVESIIVPSNRYPLVGEIVKFSSTVEASKYEWWIEGSSDPVKNTSTVAYTFNLPETYTVRLKINDNTKKIYSYPIVVVDLPKTEEENKVTGNVPKILQPTYTPPPPYVPPVDNPVSADQTQGQKTNPVIPEVKQNPTPDNNMPPRKYAYLSNAQFKERLQEVVAANKNFKDFDMYLCDGGATVVIENGTQTTFERLCQNITGEKREIVSVDYLDVKQFDDKSRCIKSLKVKHEKKKKGIFK